MNRQGLGIFQMASEETEKDAYVLLPVHNRRDITVSFANDLFAQTYKGVQLVLIDDGSTDGTAEAVLSTLPSAHVIRGDGNLWWAGSLQKGFDHLATLNLSDDTIVIISNDDVRLPSDFVEVGVTLLSSRQPSLLLAQLKEEGDEFPRESGVAFDPYTMTFQAAKRPEEINCLSTRGLFLHWGSIKAIGGFHTTMLPHYGSDYEYTIRAFRKGFSLWTDRRLFLTYLPEQTGFRGEGDSLGFRLMFYNIFRRHSVTNPFMFMSLSWLVGKRSTWLKVTLLHWLSIVKCLTKAARRSFLLSLQRPNIFQ